MREIDRFLWYLSRQDYSTLEACDARWRRRLLRGRRRSRRCRRADGVPPGHRAVLALPGRAGRPVPCDGSRAGVLHHRRPPPAQRPRQRHERLPARPRALLPLGPQAPRPRGPAQDFIPRRAYGDYIAGLLQTAAEYPGNARLERREESRARHRPPRRTLRGPPLVRPVDRGPRGRARQRLPTRHRLGPRIARRLRPTRRRPVDPGAPRRRPAARRHRPDDGRRRHLGRPARTAPCTPSRATTWSRTCTGCRPRLPCRRRPASPASTRSTSCATRSTRHVAHTVEETGDWRAAIDGLRPVTAQLWQASATRTSAASSPSTPAPGTCTATGCHRHRGRLGEITDSGRLVRHPGTLADVREVPAVSR